METKDLIDYVKECPYCNDVCKEEIIQRLEENEKMKKRLDIAERSLQTWNK